MRQIQISLTVPGVFRPSLIADALRRAAQKMAYAVEDKLAGAIHSRGLTINDAAVRMRYESRPDGTMVWLLDDEPVVTVVHPRVEFEGS